ncbi:MAG: Flp pilus assembly complex ATPase component TadA [Chloroflexi bacterium]|nr:Flp pilus assembly complex ATPase component TadA [Chloroflexota bacterium]
MPRQTATPTPTWVIQDEAPISLLELERRQAAPAVGPDPCQTVLGGVRERLYDVVRDPGRLRDPDPETRQAVRALIQEELTRYIADGQVHAWPLVADPAALLERVAHEVMGLGWLEPLLRDESIEEIIVNGPGTVFVLRAGGQKEQLHPPTGDPGSLQALINRAAMDTGRSLNTTQPILDAALPDGSRLNAVTEPIVRPWPALTIRRFRMVARTVADLVRLGTITDQVAHFLDLVIAARLNVLISGGTASGKTNFINALGALIPPEERIVTIEDTWELQLPGHDVLNLLVRPPNLDGTGGIDQTRLLANALRQRPQRIILGEARDGAAYVMIKAANTGHDGTLATVHANSAAEALDRLELLAYEAMPGLNERTMRAHVAGAFHLVVHLEQQPGGRRQVVEVLEVTGRLEQGTILKQALFADQRDGQGLVWAGYRPTARLRERLQRWGQDFESVLGGS